MKQISKEVSKEELIFINSLRKKKNRIDPGNENSYEIIINQTEEKALNKFKKENSVKSELSLSDIKFIKKVVNSYDLTRLEKTTMLLNHFSINDTKLFKWLSELDLSLEPSEFAKAKSHSIPTSCRYIISSAQNSSPVNKALLNNMVAYAKYINAEIGIIATRYKNPTSIWIEEGDVWDKSVHPYLTAKRQDLHEDLVLLADLKVQATAPNPTNGIELFGGHKSAIVGSPRIEMRSIPVLKGQKQKFLYSTGTVTTPNFTDTVAGGKAGEHHSFGFIVVEVDDGCVHIRNVAAHTDGSFNDLIFRVENEKIYKEDVEILVWGDSHFAQKEEPVTNAFRGLCADLGIQKSVLHDVWDSKSLNVHNSNNPIERHKLLVEEEDSLDDELSLMFEELEWFEEHMQETIVVASNHDDMLDRAMIYGDWRDNLKNAITFVDMLKLTLSGDAPDGIIPYYINSNYDTIKALGLNDSYILHEVELALHGHKGPNGARGNINAFSKLSTKTIIGHSHSPAIKWGCYQVGVSCALDHGYNKGLSGWAYCGVTLNKHGKRQSIIFNRDTLKYTTLL